MPPLWLKSIPRNLANMQEPSTEKMTPKEVRNCVQELLRYGFVSSDEKNQVFNQIQRLQHEIREALEPLDLTLMLDEARGLALIAVAEIDNSETTEDVWSHPLVRRQRLTLEQSLLVAILRQIYVLHEQEAGIGVSTVRLPIEELAPQLTAYLGESGSESRDLERVTTLLDQLKTHGIVTAPDKNQEVAIRPLIAHLANPETLTRLLQQFQKLTPGEPS